MAVLLEKKHISNKGGVHMTYLINPTNHDSLIDDGNPYFCPYEWQHPENKFEN